VVAVVVVVVVASKLKLHSIVVLPFLTSSLQYTRSFSRELAEIDCGQFTNILQA
jgi:hypothetical protein